MGVGVRAAGGDAHEPDAQLAEPVERRVHLGEVDGQRVGVCAEGAPRSRVEHGSPEPVRSALERRDVEGREPNADRQAGSGAADPLDDPGEQPEAVVERAAVAAGAVAGGEQLVEQVAVAVLDVHEVEAGVGGEPGGVDVALDEPVQLLVVQDRRGACADAPVQHRVALDRARRRLPRRATPAARVGELQTDHQVVGAAVGLAVGVDEVGPQRAEVVDGVRADDELVGVGAGLGATATASPPQISLAPLRRSAASGGAPGRWGPRRGCRPSPPWAAPRSGCRRRGTGRAVGDGERRRQGPAGSTWASMGRSTPSSARWSDSASGVSEALDLHDVAHGSTPRRSAISRSTSRSASGRRGQPSGTASVAIQPRRRRNIAASWR